ncbi:MAG: glycosyl transferase, family 2 [Acidimicrobiaceae bacterium]|nr:glycosyl transferase, family 2 [Acidimicrobiaceae bacterium]
MREPGAPPYFRSRRDEQALGFMASSAPSGSKSTPLIERITDEASARSADGPGRSIWIAGPGRPPPPAGVLAGPVEYLSAVLGGNGGGLAIDHASALVIVLDGVLEHSNDPGSLVSQAYHALVPGGLLVLTLQDLRLARPERIASAARGRPGVQTLFPADTLSTLLFREGFVRPRMRGVGAELVVSVERGEQRPPFQRDQKLSVVLPAYNEQATFSLVMAELLKKEIAGMEIEIIVVESNSNDGTREAALGFANEERVNLILEDRPQGKGHAVRAGLAAATGDFVLIQDADLEYDLGDYERVLEPLRDFQVGFVLGARMRSEGAVWGVRHFEENAVTSRLMNVGNAVFLRLFNLVYGQKLEDPFTMYKVMRRDCLDGFQLECDRFDFDWELTAKLLRTGHAPMEIPVTYHSRSFTDGKKISVLRDPLTWVKACFKYRFAPLEG